MDTYRFLRQEGLALLFLLIPIGLALYLWPQLPDPMATHWNVAGEVDDWLSKIAFGWILGGLLPFTYLILLFVLHLDPRPTARHNQKTLRVVRTATMGLLCVMMSALILFNAGMAVNILAITKISVPLLLLVIGNLLSKTKPNYFMGIRTPWTLESAIVWTKTHRLAGGLWVASALFLLIISFLLPDDRYPLVLIGVVLIMVLVPVGYSYLIFRKQQTVH